MIRKIEDAERIAERYGIPSEDVVYISLNASGIRSDLSFPRVRFKFSLDSDPEKFYIGSPSNVDDTPFYLDSKTDTLYLNGEIIGYSEKVEDDTCDATYLRRDGTVINLNSNTRSDCKGCGFCFDGQTSMDKQKMESKEDLDKFAKGFIRDNGLADLSHIYQVAVVTGCFGNEEKVVQHVSDVYDVFTEHGFNGELLYMGSELGTEKGFEKIRNSVDKFVYVWSLECFNKREEILNPIKRRVTVQKGCDVLKKSKALGIPATVSYIVGLDPIYAIEDGFDRFKETLGRFPIMNIFQVHEIGQKALRADGAEKIEYYLKARKTFESMFGTSELRPRSWENYRSLWYHKFGEEELDGIRI